MNCQEVTELAVKNAGQLPPEALPHLDSCRECRQFCRALSLVEPWGRQPSAELDDKCLRLARSRRQRRHRLRLWLGGLGAAAAVVIGLCLSQNQFVKDGRPVSQHAVLVAQREQLTQEDELLGDWALTSGEIDDLEIQMDLLANCY